MPKQYLGDGVYVDWWEGGLVLTTENGIEQTNAIYLEPEVYAALQAFVTRLLPGVAEAARRGGGLTTGAE